MRHSWRILLFVIVGGLCAADRSDAQTTAVGHYWLSLTERASTPATPQQLGITERALKRRAKVLPPDRLIDELDYPVSQSAIAQIQSTGATIRTESRWLNAVSVEATAEQLRAIEAISSVTSIRPVALSLSRKHDDIQPQESSPILRRSGFLGIDYGPSLTQINNMRVPELHQMGINGSGVLLGMLDDGFNNHLTHNALKGIRVVAEYDFVQKDSNTSRRPDENPTQGNHGAGTLSSIAGFENGKLVGGAYGASVVLAKTEVDSVEIHAEEDNYVAALEWMERLGVDVASSSLGYRDFDATTYSYTHEDMNGRTTIVSKAAVTAARKGLLLVTAMGNEGVQFGSGSYSPGTLVAPADADSILSVGAASSDASFLASFSGTGPTSDGRIKPEVLAQGLGVYWASGSSTTGYGYVQGTSAATPLVASVAALVFSAHPELTPMQVREALMQTAVPLRGSSVTYPNNNFGYGFLNAVEAVFYNGLAFSNRPIVSMADTALIVTTWFRSKTALVGDSVALYYKQKSGGSFIRVPLTPSADVAGHPYEYSARISRSLIGKSPVGYFTARDSQGGRRSPYNAPDSLFSLDPTPDSILNVFPTPDLESVPRDFVLYNNYPNPFNPGTTIRFFAPRAEQTELVIFNLLGQRIRTLFSGVASPGVNIFRWNDSRDDNGRPVPSGIYLCRLKTTGSVLTNKMLYLK